MKNEDGSEFHVFTDELQQPTAQEQQIQNLEDALEKATDERMEERFIWLIVVIILINVFFFIVINAFFGAFVILILELLILIPLARRMGMEEMSKLLDRILARLSSGITVRD